MSRKKVLKKKERHLELSSRWYNDDDKLRLHSSFINWMKQELRNGIYAKNWETRSNGFALQ